MKVTGIVEIERPADEEKEEFAPASAEGVPTAGGASENSGDAETSAANPISAALTEQTWLASADDEKPAPRPLEPDTDEEDEGEGISAGAFFGFVDRDEEAADESASPPKGESAEGREALDRGSMSALIDSGAPTIAPEKGKMPPNFREPDKRGKSEDRGHEIAVRCFRCYHVQHVSRYAKSTQCERCSVYISLADYEVTSRNRHTLRTRGDITIAKRGGLERCELACHNLTVHGSIDAFVDCSGIATFRGSGAARGPLHCRKLVVEKQGSIAFPDGVKTEDAEIHGKVTGDITSSGTVKIARSAVIEGTVRARSIDVKEGATITGETEIDPDVSTALPVKMGFNPSVIG